MVRSPLYRPALFALRVALCVLLAALVVLGDLTGALIVAVFLALSFAHLLRSGRRPASPSPRPGEPPSGKTHRLGGGGVRAPPGPAGSRTRRLKRLLGSQGLAFTTRIGTLIRRAKLHAESWKPLLRHAGLPDTRFHDLRHACATLLLTKSVHPKIVSELLGHSSISITLDIYSHVIPGLGEAAALAKEEVLS